MLQNEEDHAPFFNVSSISIHGGRSSNVDTTMEADQQSRRAWKVGPRRVAFTSRAHFANWNLGNLEIWNEFYRKNPDKVLTISTCPTYCQGMKIAESCVRKILKSNTLLTSSSRFAEPLDSFSLDNQPNPMKPSRHKA